MDQDRDSEFISFVRQLVDSGELEGAAAGVAARAVADGTLRGLTAQQRRALNMGVIAWLGQNFDDYSCPFVADDEIPLSAACSYDGNRMPWSEVYCSASFFDGACSYCEQVHNKPDEYDEAHP